MEVCDECLRLEERSTRANVEYVSLLFQEDRMERDGFRETMTFSVVEDALREAENKRSYMSGLLLSHCRTHQEHGKTSKARQPVKSGFSSLFRNN
jgi:hypothetical protein